jgi:HEAT repeat protein
MNEEGPPEAAAPGAGMQGGEPGREERQTTPFLVLQFFVFPLAIVAVCVTVFVIFGLIAAEGKSLHAHLAEVRTGGGMFNVKRWQAAFALASAIADRREEARNDPRFVAELIRLFEDSPGDEPQVRRYLALALGRLGDARALPALRQVVARPTRSDDAETLIYAVWSLGAIGDPAALPDLVDLAGSEDAGIRKAAVHALGGIPAAEAREAAAAALADPVEDVRWNAALALGRQADARAVPVLLQMMDRSHLAQVAGLTPVQQDDVVLEAVRVAAAVRNPTVEAAWARLREADPVLRVREAARRAAGGP